MSESSGLSFFEETASAVGTFPVARRGYDRAAVDEYVLGLERDNAQMRDQLNKLRRDVEDARAEASRPRDVDFADLGGHTTEILRIAQAQAKEITDRAAAEAERITSEANRMARQTLDLAEREGEDMKIAAAAGLREQRSSIDARAQQVLDAARSEADQLVTSAEQSAAAVTAEAQRKASGLLEAARLEGASIRQAAEKEAAEVRATSATERDQLLTRLRTEHEEAQAKTQAMLSEASTNHERARAQVAESMKEAQTIRSNAMAAAEQMKIHSAREAELAMTEAQKRVKEMLHSAEGEASKRTEALRRENELLLQRKKAIMGQLQSLSSIATQTAAEFPDIDTELLEDAAVDPADAPPASKPTEG